MYRKLIPFVKRAYQSFNRNLSKDNSLINLPITPLCDKFGFERGTPIDRYYIEKFLYRNSKFIKGHVLEIADDAYSRKFGRNVTSYGILFPDNTLERATIIGDLTKSETIPENVADCFIATQTFNFIFDFKEAITNSRRLLNKNGVLLATVSCISQISLYDMERWGDYWRFTSLSAKKVFEHTFGEGNVELFVSGNAFAATSLLQGVVVEEIDVQKLDSFDNGYECIIGIRATKR
jgi:hypothetical protein